MVPIHKILWHEWREKRRAVRVPEPEAMEDPEQIRSYVKAYAWGGPTSALQLYHLRQLACMIRSGDTVLDLACGPGPLLLELAALFPDCQFIGADLSAGMLAHLASEARARGFSNVRVLQEDIRTLPSLTATKVDMVISTSALHHLPDADSLRAVMQKTAALLPDDGGVYMFDFGLLKSEAARRLMVVHIANEAPAITVRDYEMSLRAAFPIGTVRQAVHGALGQRVRFTKSAFVDFFYFVQGPRRAAADRGVQATLRGVWGALPAKYKLELQMLQRLQVSG
jgi:SAM-dependent methyltransferase